MNNKMEFRCARCRGRVQYSKKSGWGHINATGCVSPAVNKESWERFLKHSREMKER